jgi:hypothetical protein
MKRIEQRRLNVKRRTLDVDGTWDDFSGIPLQVTASGVEGDRNSCRMRDLLLRATLGDEITASHGKSITLRAVRKTIAGRGVDTIIIGMVGA